MIQITAGMTPTEFLEAVNYSFLPAATPLTANMQGATFKTNYDANYEANKITFTSLPDKSPIVVGMSAGSYIDALNANILKTNTEFDTTYPFGEELYEIPNHYGSEYLCVWNYVLPAVLKLANDRTLISCMQRGGTTLSRENFVIVRDIEGNYSTRGKLGHDIVSEGTYDGHGRAVFIEKAGVIYGFHEALPGVSENLSGSHGGQMIVVKSLDEGATWTEVTRFGTKFEYPQVFMLGTDIYCYGRETITASPPTSVTDIYKSSDDCETWTKLTTLHTEEANYWRYFRLPENTLTDEINMILTPMPQSADGHNHTSYPAFLYIRSYNGITWYNCNRSWSKNVDVAGAITKTEMLANCKICGGTNLDLSHSYGGSFIKNDKLYMLVAAGAQQDYDVDGWDKINFTSLKIYENNTVLIDLSSLITGNSYLAWEQTFLLLRNNNIFSVLQLDLVNNNDLKIHTVGLGGVLETRLLKAGVSDKWGQQFAGVTFNSDRITGRQVVVTKVTGSMLDRVFVPYQDGSYSDLIVFNNI
jgi:hypothetical protein